MLICQNVSIHKSDTLCSVCFFIKRFQGLHRISVLLVAELPAFGSAFVIMNFQLQKNICGGRMIRNFMCVLALISLCAIAGCGAADSGGSTALFEDGTVTYSVSPVVANFTSIIGSTPTSDTNICIVTPTNTAFTSSIRKSPYTIENFTVRYTKTNDSYFFETYPLNIQPQMLSGGSVAIPVIIATASAKEKFLNRGFIDTEPWEFYVNASYTVREDYSNKTKDFQVRLGTVRFQ